MMLKSPNSVVPIDIDWSGLLTESDAIIRSSWAVRPAHSEVHVSDEEFDDKRVRALLGGGRSEELVNVINKIETRAGFVVERGVVVRIGQERAVSQ